MVGYAPIYNPQYVCEMLAELTPTGLSRPKIGRSSLSVNSCFFIPYGTQC
jgi:hypothetical protein